MPRIAQRIAIIVGAAASIIGYLYHAPHSEGMAQLSRVRALGATMKIVYWIVCNLVFILFYNIVGFFRVE